MLENQKQIKRQNKKINLKKIKTILFLVVNSKKWTDHNEIEEGVGNRNAFKFSNNVGKCILLCYEFNLQFF